MACKNLDLDRVRSLLELRANVHYQDRAGSTCLCHAVERANRDVLECTPPQNNRDPTIIHHDGREDSWSDQTTARIVNDRRFRIRSILPPKEELASNSRGLRCRSVAHPSRSNTDRVTQKGGILCPSHPVSSNHSEAVDFPSGASCSITRTQRDATKTNSTGVPLAGSEKVIPDGDMGHDASYAVLCELLLRAKASPNAPRKPPILECENSKVEFLSSTNLSSVVILLIYDSACPASC